MTRAEQACLDTLFTMALERWEAKAKKAKEPHSENYAEGGIQALRELRDQIERLEL